MSWVIVRPVRPEEHAGVGELLVTAYQVGDMRPDEPYWDVLRDVGARTVDAEVWVAEEEGRVVGSLTWAAPGSRQRETAHEDEAEFRMLGVAPAAQGHGVGAALLAAALERARKDGYAAVAISSATWMTSAHRMYEAAGFRRVPERDWSPAPRIHLVVYRLEL